MSLASGLALSKQLKRETGTVFCLTSDGECQEGSTWEALIFACHHRLANLVILVDHNQLQGFGNTHDVASMSPLAKKLSGFDVDITTVNGHDLAEIRSALQQSSDTCRVIILNTVKGHGISFRLISCFEGIFSVAIKDTKEALTKPDRVF